MSFSISLMRNNSPKEQLNKDLTVLQTITGTLKEETSILTPVILVECDLSNFVNCNYAHIPEFNRYYFIDDVKSINNNLVEFSGRVDVLTTYKNEILNNYAIVRRQENSWNLYLNDGSFKVYQNPMVLTKAFPSGFTTQELVLAVAGS